MSTQELELRTMQLVIKRLMPLLFLLYLFCFLDRINVGMAALQMNGALRFGAGTFGFGAGIFFLGYALFEVPSNVILARVGARRWIARIAITWGLLACAMAWVRTPTQFYIVRFLLGAAEAGFFPGVIYYLSRWIPTAYRARTHAAFMIAIPSAYIVGGPLGGALLGLNVRHLAGWQWLFLIEGLPSVLLGLAVLRYLTDSPDDADWLSKEERGWLSERLEREQQQITLADFSVLRTLGNPLVWVLTIPYFAFYTVALGFQLWAPTLVRDALKATNATTGLVIGGIYALAILVYFLAGMLSDRKDERCAVAALGLAVACAGCIGAAVITPSSPLRVVAFTLIAMLSPLFLASFWCLPTRFLKGPSAAAGIGLVSAIGSSGGFFGPNIIGTLKQTTGSDVGAFLGLAAIALLGTLVCLGLRRTPSLKPQVRAIGVVPTTPRS